MRGRFASASSPASSKPLTSSAPGPTSTHWWDLLQSEPCLLEGRLSPGPLEQHGRAGPLLHGPCARGEQVADQRRVVLVQHVVDAVASQQGLGVAAQADDLQEVGHYAAAAVEVVLATVDEDLPLGAQAPDQVAAPVELVEQVRCRAQRAYLRQQG